MAAGMFPNPGWDGFKKKAAGGDPAAFLLEVCVGSVSFTGGWGAQ